MKPKIQLYEIYIENDRNEIDFQMWKVITKKITYSTYFEKLQSFNKYKDKNKHI